MQPLTAQAVADLLAGPYELDWWDGDPREGQYELVRALFLRVAEAGEEERVAHPLWRGKCALLTERGCSLPFEGRPTNCRLLDPAVCLTKKVPNGKHAAALEWLPYQDLLTEALLLAGGDERDLYEADTMESWMMMV